MRTAGFLDAFKNALLLNLQRRKVALDDPATGHEAWRVFADDCKLFADVIDGLDELVTCSNQEAKRKFETSLRAKVVRRNLSSQGWPQTSCSGMFLPLKYFFAVLFCKSEAHSK